MNPVKLVPVLVVLTIFTTIPTVVMADGDDEKGAQGAQYGNATRLHRGTIPTYMGNIQICP